MRTANLLSVRAWDGVSVFHELPARPTFMNKAGQLWNIRRRHESRLQYIALLLRSPSGHCEEARGNSTARHHGILGRTPPTLCPAHPFSRVPQVIRAPSHDALAAHNTCGYPASHALFPPSLPTSAPPSSSSTSSGPLAYRAAYHRHTGRITPCPSTRPRARPIPLKAIL